MAEIEVAIVAAPKSLLMRWQIGTTPRHWLYEVWIDGLHAPDAVAVDASGHAIVMRFEDRGYERDGMGRVKADLVVGAVELRRSNPSQDYRDSEKTSPDPYDVIVCQTEQVLRIGAGRPALVAVA